MPNLALLFLLSVAVGFGVSALWIVPILIWKRPKTKGWPGKIWRHLWAAPVWLVGCAGLFVFTSAIPADSTMLYYLVVVAATAAAAVALIGRDRDVRPLAIAIAAAHIMIAIASGGLWVMAIGLGRMQAAA
jgi:hypothetical protein